MKGRLNILVFSPIFTLQWLKTMGVCIIVFIPFGCGSVKKIQTLPSTLSIVAFGDSITAQRKNVGQVFAQRLPVLLGANGIRCQVINAGVGSNHSGRQSDYNYPQIRHGMDRFEVDVLNKNADVVIIGFGTNDAYIDSNVASGSSRISTELYRKNLNFMISSLKKRSVKVILMAPNPLGIKRPDFQNARLYEYVKIVRELSKSHRTALVDNYQSFQNFQTLGFGTIDDLLQDSVHPNDKGHEIIASNILHQILNLVNQKNI